MRAEAFRKRLYYTLDSEVDARKKNAIVQCARLAAVDPLDYEAQYVVIREMFGTVGEVVNIMPGFTCDDGKNIHVGEDFLANYHVTILDIAPVHIGDHCMIGHNTLITTVGHPLSPAGRRRKLAYGKPVTIGNDVWIASNCTILAGVPARVIKTLEINP